MSLTKERLRFSTFDDLCLLHEVLALNPFEDSSRWKDVLTAIVKGTSKKFSLRAVKEHLQYILMLWAKEDRSNIRKSGTEEEYDEKEVLLQQVTDLSREFRGKTKPINVTPNKAKIIGSDIRNIAVIEEGQASANTDTILEYGDTSEIPSEFDLQKSARKGTLNIPLSVDIQIEKEPCSSHETWMDNVEVIDEEENEENNLRDVYVRDMKKLKTLKSGSAAMTKSTSAYFQRLTFLQPTVQKNQSDSSFQVEDDNINDTSESIDGNIDSNLRPPSENPPTTKKFKLHPADEHFAKILEKSMNQRKLIQKEEEDEDKLFCLSLFKEIKKVPENNRLRLKIEIYNLIARQQVQENSPLSNASQHDFLSSTNQPSTSFGQHNAQSQERHRLSRHNQLVSQTQQYSVRHSEHQPHSQYGYTTYTQAGIADTNSQYIPSPLSSAESQIDLFNDRSDI
ncbi:hypothetical protein FQR65_LT16531 [Abscondita terminalis]|nr:hypothetical protein FQR65_LT16531 [Abscondita terminalis]